MAPSHFKKQASISRFFSPASKKVEPTSHTPQKRAAEQVPAYKARKSKIDAGIKVDASDEVRDKNAEPSDVGVNEPSEPLSNETLSPKGANPNPIPNPEANPKANPNPNPKSNSNSKANPKPNSNSKANPKPNSNSKANPKPNSKAAKPPKLTPLEQQYSQLKRENPDKVLAIQVGYKYKFFGQDAVVAAQLLNIMLIPGNIKLEERAHDRFAYCSIPDVRLHIHLQRLLNQGLKVGVVKQTESAAIKNVESSKSSLFERRISAVYTRATYMGDENVTDKPEDNNDDYIVCVYETTKHTFIVGVQPATGEIIHDEFPYSRDSLDTRLAYMRPSEVILMADSGEADLGLAAALRRQNPAVSVQNTVKPRGDDIDASLAEFFSSAQSDHLVEYFQLNFSAGILACIHELIRYLEQFKLSNIFTVTSNISAFSDSRMYMVLPAGTLRALDVFEVQDSPASRKGTLLWLLDRTITRSGAKMLRKWVGRPLVRKEDIVKRLNAVETLNSGEFVHIIDAFRGALSKLGKSGVEIDRSLTKIHYSASQENDRVSRKEVYLMLKSMTDILQVFRDFGPASLAEFRSKFPNDQFLSEILEQMLGFGQEKTVDDLLAQIDPGVALSQLDVAEMKQRFFNLESDAKFAGVVREKSAIESVEQDLHTELVEIRKFLKRPQLNYVTVLKDTHLVEVRNGKQTDGLPADWLKVSATKTVSRYRTASTEALHKKLQYHTEKLMQECDKCFKTYLREIDSHHEYIRQVVTCLAKFDCLLSLAAAGSGHVKPEIVERQIIQISSGLHPVLSHMGPAYVPNDVDISYDENRVLIITGPNMGGKSSLVKQIALSVIMAQVGCFLPCTQAKLGVFDSVHIRMGASDNILRGRSTFMVEMQECASIVQEYTSKSLVILDEIGRGTGTKDGVALAYAILKHIIQDPQSPVTLFITHYPSLHVLEKEHSAVHNFHMAFLERQAEGDWPEVIFLYKVIRGVAANSYGLNVAKLAGIPKEIIDAAHDISEKMKFELEGRKLLETISHLDKGSVFESLNRILDVVESQ